MYSLSRVNPGRTSSLSLSYSHSLTLSLSFLLSHTLSLPHSLSPLFPTPGGKTAHSHSRQGNILLGKILRGDIQCMSNIKSSVLFLLLLPLSLSLSPSHTHTCPHTLSILHLLTFLWLKETFFITTKNEDSSEREDHYTNTDEGYANFTSLTGVSECLTGARVLCVCVCGRGEGRKRE